MRIPLLSLFLLFLASRLSGQAPQNDDCPGAIDLGILPMDCSGQIYNNVNAAPGNLSVLGGVPGCFNGNTVNRDVYFTFSTNDTLVDITILLQGTDMGPNGPITNPQIAIFRGDCSGLAFLGDCSSASQGDNQLQLDILGLTPNTTYYLVVNDYSASATPNSGDFTLCVEQYVPAVNIGDQPGSASCFGTLFDTGGPDGDYASGQNLTFVIEPDDVHQCIEITVSDFQLENSFDYLNFYAGPNANAPLIASLTGTGNGQPFVIQASSSAVTVEFTSDFSIVAAGFELAWSCSPLACDGSSFDNPISISGLPFNQGGYSSCDDAANFSGTPCSNAPFLNGPEVVFAYESAGGFCANVSATGASSGTGIAVLNGPPNAPGTLCLAQSSSGTVNSVDFEDAGIYYIIVANGQGCTDFGLSITEASCSLNPSLLGSLCNPLNGCVNPDGLPSTFVFNPGFEDIEFTLGVNNGCWGGTGLFQPNYYWFTIEAQADGPFGFIVQAADPAEASDIDFNVWGPFTRQQACEDPLSVKDFIENNQPIRSSWDDGAQPTGLAFFNANGDPVTDEYDCDPAPGANGDDFASVIMAQEGEIYVVLLNDWQNNIASGAMSVDWSPSDTTVIGVLSTALIQMDTAICAGESVQLMVDAPAEDVTWISDTATLSCVNCSDPIATPTETTVYTAIVDAVCYVDTVQVTVQVYEVDAGPDLTICLNEDIQLNAGSDLLFAEFEWTAPAGVTLSCTDCPDPIVTADAPGPYIISVTLTGVGCTLGDQMTLTVLPEEAAVYTISDDLQICIGQTVDIGGDEVMGNTYAWTSVPPDPGLDMSASNPSVSPDATTVYYLEVLGPNCPIPSLDSVRVEVFLPPTLNIRGDTSVCQGDSVIMGNTLIEPGVAYSWAGPPAIGDPTDPNSAVLPQTSGTYTLTAVRGACEVTASFEVEVTPIAIEIRDTNMVALPDTVRICRGQEVALRAGITPADSIPLWTSTEPGFDTLLAAGLTVSPQSVATYYAEVGLDNGCFRIDSVVVLVDSLPANNVPFVPVDTTVCEGAPVTLMPPSLASLYEPSDFPDIEFLWTPSDGLDTPDTLAFLVVTAQSEGTYVYQRVARSGFCSDTATFTLNVNPTPEITIIPNDTSICIGGGPVQLNATVNEEVTEFEWISGQESLSCDDCLNPLANPAGTTTYTLEAKVEECPAQASATVRVLGPPQFLLNTETTVCEGRSIQLIFSPDANATYTWTATDPDFGTVVSSELTVTPDETTTYFLVADNEVCDPVLADITIEVLPAPILSAQASADSICRGDQVTLTAQVENGQPGDEFFWEDSNGNSLGQGASIIVSPNNSAAFTVKYVSTIGCDAVEATVDVTVLPDPVADPIGNTTICFGDFIILNNESDPATTTYTWTSTDPNFTDFSNPEPEVSPEQTATYTLSASNGTCPDIIAEIVIDVIPVPVLSAGISPEVVCAGETVTLAADVPGSREGDTFTWVDGNGVEAGTGQQLTATPPASTDYTVTYVSSFGCGTLTETVSVEVRPAPVASPIADTVICLGQSVILNTDSDTLTTIYTWTSTDPNFMDFSNPEPEVSPVQTATYSLAASTGACPDIVAEITVEVIGQVALSIDVSDEEICPGQEVTLTAVTGGGTAEDSFFWEGSDGTTFEGNPITVNPLVLTEYTLTYQDAAGCQTLTESVTIDVEADIGLEGISIEPDSAGVLYIGDQVVLTASYDTDFPGQLTFTWTRNDSIVVSGPDIDFISETLLMEGEIIYKLVVETDNGCRDSASVLVTVEVPDVAVPNAFTPNGDGTNDFFNFVAEGGEGAVTLTEFKVFNRWGQLIYDNENPGLGWDGTFNGNPQPSEVYFYMISVSLSNGEAHPDSPFRGDVTLLR